ncbi:MAG: alkaline phosphatase family protein [Bdellovibrionaceae bacterium]|nr:alkaline phosphatase family protein [Pseudobdellovibrionaceae bacterium]
MMKLQIKNILLVLLLLFVYSCQSNPVPESSVSIGDVKKIRYERPKETPGKEALLNIPYRTIDTSKSFTTFGFGSCNDQNLEQPLWKLIKARSPQLFLMMGDNVYASKAANRPIMDQYVKLNENKDYLDLREAVPFMATWDDHDYGQQDGGEDNPYKQEARKVFAQYWTYLKNIMPKTQGAIYHSRILGEGKKRTQFIMLDTRYDRSPLVKAPEPPAIMIPVAPPMPTTPILNTNENPAEFKSDNKASPVSTPVKPIAPLPRPKMYGANEDAKAHILSNEQWKWLEAELKKPAELRIIVSSIQIIADDHGFEKWGNFPLERKKFLELLNKNNIRNAVVLSGDRHLAAVAKIQLNKKTELYDITSSALNRPTSATELEVDQTYVTPTYLGINFGLATIDWTKRQLDIQIIGEDDKTQLNQSITF